MGGGVVGGEGGRVEVISGKGCSRLFLDFSSSFRGVSPISLEHLSPASFASPISESMVKISKSTRPFSGLVICVTGFSKETREQVKEATERLGGEYSPHLHRHCTHLVVQSFIGRKFEHALKYGPANGLFVVTIGWFVDSVRRNVRLDEKLYNVHKIGDSDIPSYVFRRVDSGAENSRVLDGLQKHTKETDMIDAYGSKFPVRESKKRTITSFISGQSFYIDNNVPAELRSKVAEAILKEGAILVEQWFVGCNVTHVVCESSSVQKYLGHSSNVVTPLWVLKSAKEKSLQRLLHLSVDLARYSGAMLDTLEHGVSISNEEIKKVINNGNAPTSPIIKGSHMERQTRVKLAKDGIRKRRNGRMQTCQTPIRPITPGALLSSICWSISESTSTASIYTESSSVKNATDETSFVNLSRSLTESEKSELIFKGHFLTIMFPVDRFSEMGPRSRTFYSDAGFRCSQVLEYIYAFYQENMSAEEMEMAIHTDSRHADRLRSAYSSNDTAETDCLELRRIDFLGSRKSFEMLKRVSGDYSCSNVYELLIRA